LNQDPSHVNSNVFYLEVEWLKEVSISKGGIGQAIYKKSTPSLIGCCQVGSIVSGDITYTEKPDKTIMVFEQIFLQIFNSIYIR
jgi:hypothetical protein